MKINKSLNLVIPIEDESGAMYVYSTPISRLIYEQHFLVISKTWAKIFAEGLGVIAGSRIAYLMLKQVATEMGQWEQVQLGLINEIIRLSNVMMLGLNGWQTKPLQSLIDKKLIDENTLSDIVNELVFFTLVSVVNKKNQLESMMETVNGLWGSHTTLLDSTEYMSSLPILTEEGNTGERESI